VRVFPNEREKEILRAYATGLSAQETAEALGSTLGEVTATVCVAGVSREGPLPPRSRAWGDQRMTDDIVAAYRAGDSTYQIAARTGFSPRTIRRCLERAGVPRRPGADRLNRS
jgi:DNA-binding CsgD family transcriptional regulator